MKTVIAQEVAEQEFDRVCDFFDVDADAPMEDDEQESFSRLKAKIVRAISTGSLSINDNGAPTFVTKSGVELTFKEPTGATLLVKTKDDDPVRKMLAIAMELTGGKTSPSKLSIRDTSVLASIVNLFMSELA